MAGGHGGHGGVPGGKRQPFLVEGYTPDDFEAAKAADEKAARQAYVRDLATSGALYMIGRGERAPKPEMKVPSAMQTFLAKRGIAQEDAAGRVAAEERARAKGPAPASFGAPPELNREEAFAAGYGKAPPQEKPRRPVPAAWKEQLVARGIDAMTIDSMDEDQAFQFLKQKPDSPTVPPTEEQLSRGAALGLKPAEGEDSESFEKAIRAAHMAATDARRQAGITYIVGLDGRVYGAPTKGPVTAPVPVPTPAPAPSGDAGFRKDKDLSGVERNRLSDIAADVKHVESLGRDFKDEYAGMGPLGAAGVWAAQRAGSAGTEGMQKLGEFWSRYERMINIPERHEKFGSALTPQEKQSWDAARNIRPGVDPKVARRAFTEIAEITRNAMQRLGDALVADGYGAEAVKAATGGLYQPQAGQAGEVAAATAAAPVRRFTRVDGKLVEVTE